jgi:S-adenosylmethionine:tRNA ribosyltransferase-isomerase
VNRPASQDETIEDSAVTPGVVFDLPEELEAPQPAELRGLRRDQVRLMVLPRFSGAPIHTRFDALQDFIKAGDLLVVNNSRTLPAALRAEDEQGRQLEVRLANRRLEDTWDVLLLDGRTRVGRAGMHLSFGEGLSARILAPSPDLSFLWLMQFDRCCMQLLDLIYRLGEPIHYAYVKKALPLDFYQTVYASQPGSVEMPSAGRPFSWEMLIQLQRAGVDFAAITLHTGLSSALDDQMDAKHPIYPEAYEVKESTAQAVNATRLSGSRVIAVGTSVVRTLETMALPDGSIRQGSGVTRLHITQGFPLRVVDALLTGMHAPQASHLDLLSAFIEPGRLQAAYLEAIQRGYLWHEFGDMNLII